jgi:hypothetical protein
MMVRVLDGVDEKGKPFRINATELMHKSDGKWRYVVDHASFRCAARNAGGTINPCAMQAVASKRLCT